MRNVEYRIETNEPAVLKLVDGTVIKITTVVHNIIYMGDDQMGLPLYQVSAQAITSAIHSQTALDRASKLVEARQQMEEGDGAHA